MRLDYIFIPYTANIGLSSRSSSIDPSSYQNFLITFLIVYHRFSSSPSLPSPLSSSILSSSITGSDMPSALGLVFLDMAVVTNGWLFLLSLIWISFRQHCFLFFVLIDMNLTTLVKPFQSPPHQIVMACLALKCKCIGRLGNGDGISKPDHMVIFKFFGTWRRIWWLILKEWNGFRLDRAL